MHFQALTLALILNLGAVLSITSQASSYETCGRIEHYKSKYSFWIINSCPSVSKFDKNFPEISQQCKNPDSSSIAKIPVTNPATNQTYRNIYCAICHNAYEDIVRWRLNIACDGQIPINQISGLASFQHCDHKIAKPHRVNLQACTEEAYKVKRDVKPTSILPASNIGLGYSTLLNFGLDGRTHIMVTSDVEEFLSKAQCKSSEQIYNPFSQTCINFNCPVDYISLNGECVEHRKFVTETKHLCMDYFINYNLTEGASIQSDDLKQAVVWRLETKFNITSILFPENILANSSHCLQTAQGSYDQTWVDKPDHSGTSSRIQITASETFQSNGYCSSNESEEIIMSIRFAMEMDKISYMTQLAKVYSMPFIIQAMDQNRTEKIGSGCIRSVKPQVLNTEWCNGIKNEYKNDEFELITEGNTIIGLRIYATNKTYYPSEFLFTGIIEGSFWGDITQIASTCDAFPSINQSTANCAKIAINPGEYELLANGSIRISQFEVFENMKMPYEKAPRKNSVQTVFGTHEYEFIKNGTNLLQPDMALPSSNQSVLICLPENLLHLLIELELWNKINISQSCSYLQAFGQGSTIAGLVCSAISFIAIVLVLVTYSLFKSLRTLPGISLMHLSIAIIMSQATFIAGLFIPSNPELSETACFPVAVLTHYFTLSSFMWMNVMAYSSYKAFGADLKTRLMQLNRKHLMLNGVYGWGIPAVIVGCCAIIDSALREQGLIAYGVVSSVKVLNETNTSTGTIENIKVTYQTMSTCWIGNSKAALIIFGLPMVYCMILNLAMFIKTCYGMKDKKTLKTVKSNIKLRRDSGSGKLKDHNEMSIHMRLSVQYGFAWIFAIVIILVGTSKSESAVICYTLYILNLIFNVLNGCTGLFIFIAFICNRRILHLYKTRFLKKGFKQHRSYSSQSVFRISTSKLTSMTSLSPVTPPDSPTGWSDETNSK